MNHRIESLEIKSRQVPKVLANLRNVLEPFSKLATFKQVGIKADDFVARRVQHRHGNRSDITLVACKQYLHQRSAPLGKWIKTLLSCVPVAGKKDRMVVLRTGLDGLPLRLAPHHAKTFPSRPLRKL